MVISAGARLGSCEILAAFGAGARGEVYRPRDRQLDRDVALKVSPERIAPDSRARIGFPG